MAKPRSGLGRDFYSLLDDNVLASDRTNAASSIRLSDIEPRSNQPRKVFEREPLEALADSIAEFGVLQPIVVRESALLKGTYEILAGERRWRAARMAGLIFPLLPGGVTMITSGTPAIFAGMESIKTVDG